MVRMTGKKKFILFGAIGAIVGTLVIVAVRHVIAVRPFIYAGTLETTKIVLSARIGSDVSAFNVIEGDMVAAGQPLLEMSCDIYKIMAAQIDNDYDRAVALMTQGHMSQAEFDILSRNKRDNDLKLSWCIVTSPINGMVVNKFREVGEVVGPGAALVSLANPYDIWAYFYVPYGMLHRLRVGQTVTGFLPEADNAKFPGRIVKISEEAEFTPKNVQTRAERTRLVYGVKVKFENPNLTLKSGMTIESTLINE